MSEQVNHPKHYNAHPSGVECIDIVEHMTFNCGNAIKYIWRAGLKPDTGTILDLEKAKWYVEREIERLSQAPSPRWEAGIVIDSDTPLGDIDWVVARWLETEWPRNEPATTAEVAEVHGISVDAARASLNRIQKMGHIHHKIEDGKARWSWGPRE